MSQIMSQKRFTAHIPHPTFSHYTIERIATELYIVVRAKAIGITQHTQIVHFLYDSSTCATVIMWLDSNSGKNLKQFVAKAKQEIKTERVFRSVFMFVSLLRPI